MYKCAIVRCGAISQKHIDSLLDLKGKVKIAALCDKEISKAEEKAAQLNDCRIYSDFDTMLENEELDALHICTPHYLHVGMAVKALEKNVAVLSEKPAAINKNQFVKLKKAADGKKYCVCFQNRYNAATLEAKKLLHSGKFGEIKGVRAFVTWKRFGEYYTASDWRGIKLREGGGVLMNQAIHTLDLMTYLAGRPVSVVAHAFNDRHKNEIDEEDTVHAFLRFPSFEGIFYATTAFCLDEKIILDFSCESGRIRIEGNTLRVSDKNGVCFTDYSEHPKSGKSVWGSSHEKLIRDFYASLEKGLPFSTGLENVKDSFDTVNAIYASSEKGQEVKI